MRITVFGANGKVGQLVTAEALARGHEVVAFVHLHASFETSEQLSIIKGDVHSFYDVANAIQGSDAVVSALGSWGTKEKDIVSRGIRNIVDCMEADHILRLVTLTGADARAKGDQVGWLNRLSHFLIRHSPAKKMLRDGEHHIAILEASSLEWMTVRSPIMNNRGVSRYKLSVKPPLPWASINRKAVVCCMIDQLETATYVCKAPYIVQ